MTSMNGVNIETGKVEVAEYSKADAAIAELRQRYSDISAVDPDTPEGYAELKAGIKEVSSYRTALESKRKEIKAPFLEAGRVIDAEAKRITAALLDLEDPMKAKKKERDEREKRQKEERLNRLRAKIQQLEQYANKAIGRSSTEIAELIEELDAIDTEQDFFDLTTEACAAKHDTLARLNEMFTERLAFERTEKEREELAAELARLRQQQPAPPPEDEKPAGRFTQPVAPKREADGSIQETHITITKREYMELCRARDTLAALEAAGVDTWEGYAVAMREVA